MEDTRKINFETDSKNLQIEISKDLVYQELDGEMVLLDMKSGQYFGIDEIGCRIWRMLEDKVPPVSIIEKLLEEYEVEKDLCRQQVVTFLEKLEHNNLISYITPPAAPE